MPGRDPEGPHAPALQRVEVGHRRRRTGALRAHRPARRAARGLPRRADPAGQRPLEAAGHEGDRLPPGLLVRGLPRAVRDDHVLDLAPRDAGRRGPDRVRPRLAHLAEVAARAIAVPRAGRLARRATRGRARRAPSSTPSPSSSKPAAAPSTTASPGTARRRTLGHRRAHGARLALPAGRGALPRDERRRHVLALPPPRRPLARRVVLPGRLGRVGLPNAVARRAARDLD